MWNFDQTPPEEVPEPKQPEREPTEDFTIWGNGMPLFVSGKQFDKRGDLIAYITAAMTPYLTTSTPNDEEFLIRMNEKTYVLMSTKLLHMHLSSYFTEETIRNGIEWMVWLGIITLHPLSDIQEGKLYVELV